MTKKRFYVPNDAGGDAGDAALSVFRHCTLHGLAEAATPDKRSRHRLAWGACFALGTALCFLHLYYLYLSMTVSPNQVTMSYEYDYNIEFPIFQVCPRYGGFIDAQLVKKRFEAGNITMEKIHMMKMALGIVDHNHLWYGFYDKLNFTLALEEYHNSIEEHGNIVDAIMDFYSTYKLPISSIVARCENGTSHPVDCGEVFSYVHNVYGLCLATKPHKLSTTGIGSLGSFRFYLRQPEYISTWLDACAHANCCRDAHDKCAQWQGDGQCTANAAWMGEHCRQSCGACGRFAAPRDDTLIMAVNDAVDATPQWPSPVFGNKGDINFFLIRKTRHVQIAGNEDKCLSRPKLKHFSDYTFGNCGWEKGFIDLLHVLNVTCTLPVLHMIPFRQLDDTPPFGNGVPNASNLCPLERILDLHRFDHAYGNVNRTYDGRPRKVWDLLEITEPHLAKMPNPCPPPCDHAQHVYTLNSGKDVDDRSIFVQLQYESHNVQTTEEIPRMSVSEYVALVGGNIGLWIGASMISLLHLCALAYKALIALLCPQPAEADGRITVVRVHTAPRA